MSDVRRLYRSRSDKKLGGVCGLAEYFQLDQALYASLGLYSQCLAVQAFSPTSPSGLSFPSNRRQPITSLGLHTRIRKRAFEDLPVLNTRPLQWLRAGLPPYLSAWAIIQEKPRSETYRFRQKSGMKRTKTVKSSSLPRSMQALRTHLPKAGMD